MDDTTSNGREAQEIADRCGDSSPASAREDSLAFQAEHQAPIDKRIVLIDASGQVTARSSVSRLTDRRRNPRKQTH